MHDLLERLRLLHQARALAAPHDLRHRAAGVDINQVEAPEFFGDHGGARHDVGVVAVDVRGERALVGP
ncbi:MAG: hypothetical protein NTY53_25485 [Kiritimatiellaeota bacterium]|nr:hypothetical protein [Kiritimatiellota bacterium]